VHEDGRLSRTARSRRALCEACVDLVESGVLQPSADQIAERAGLSRRSVFNHFRDLAELYDAVADVGMRRYAPLLEDVAADLPLADRVQRLAETRARFLEATAPFTRALTAQALVESTAPQAWRISQAALRRQQAGVERLFARDLARLPARTRRETLEALFAATAPLTWELLRHSRGLSRARARAVVARTVTALLREAGVGPA
jgi:AcrR family transcriptional regulator